MAAKPKTIKKTECATSRAEFAKHATPVQATVLGIPYTLPPRTFKKPDGSPGSLGFNLSEKGTIVINGKAVKVQIGVNITVVNSKDLPMLSEEELKAAA